jgi:hypothetical protein
MTKQQVTVILRDYLLYPNMDVTVNFIACCALLSLFVSFTGPSSIEFKFIMTTGSTSTNLDNTYVIDLKKIC